MAVVLICNITPVVTSWYQYYCINPTGQVVCDVKSVGTLSGEGKNNKIIAAAPPPPPVNTHVEDMNLVLVELWAHCAAPDV